MKVTLLGAGSWGTAIAHLLSKNVDEVVLYAHKQEVVDEINIKHTNSKYVEVSLDKNVKATMDLKEAVKDAEIIFVSVPSFAAIEVVSEAVKYIDKKVIWVNTSKGFYVKTKQLITHELDIAIPESKRASVISLMGPTHAEEVAKDLYTAACVVGEKHEEADMKKVRDALVSNNFRLYLQHDVVGAEYGASLKNIYAICSGMLSAIGLGDNARAALISRSLVEIARFAKTFGAKSETFLGLTGVGDLVVTTSSIHSRNYRMGLAIAKHGKASIAIEKEKMTAEGIYATKFAYEIAQENNIRMPLLDVMYKIIYEDLEVVKALEIIAGNQSFEENV